VFDNKEIGGGDFTAESDVVTVLPGVIWFRGYNKEFSGHQIVIRRLGIFPEIISNMNDLK
jgi:hypothetical protein